MKIIQQIYRKIDSVNNFIGKINAFVILPLLAIIFLEVLLRRGLNHPQIWTFEVSSMLFCCYISLASAYSLQKSSMVSIDTIKARLSLRKQHRIRLFTYAVTLLCMLLGVLPQAFHSFLQAFLQDERIYSVWSPVLWPLKGCFCLGLLLLALQILSEFLKQVEWLYCNRHEQNQGKQEAQG